MTKNYQCFREKTITANSKNIEYQGIRSSFPDTLNNWMYVRKLRYYENDAKIYNIKLDTLIFFNDSLNRAFLFLHLQSKINCKCTDITVLIAAEKLGEKWNFYNCVNFQYIISKGRDERYSFDELGEMSVSQVMSDGLVKKYRGCQINEQYYYNKKWFPEKRIYYHQKFLQNKY